jgi:hypothetical protein
MPRGTLTINSYRFDISGNIGDPFNSPAIGSPSGPIPTRNLPSYVPDAAPPVRFVRELTQLTLPIGADFFEAGKLPELSSVNFFIGLQVGGVVVWRQQVSLPLSPFTTTAVVGQALFSADLQNSVKVEPGQAVRIVASGLIAKGMGQGTITWATSYHQLSPEFLEWDPVNSGALSYVDVPREEAR